MLKHGRKKTFGINENGAILIFFGCTRKNVQKGIFFLHSTRSPHRTAKLSRGCFPLAHPRALPAVMVSDRRSASAMYEFPFECRGPGVCVAVTLFHVALNPTKTKRGFLTTTRSQSPAWLSGAMRRSRAITKKTYYSGTFLFANLLDGAYNTGKTKRRGSRCLFAL